MTPICADIFGSAPEVRLSGAAGDGGQTDSVRREMSIFFVAYLVGCTKEHMLSLSQHTILALIYQNVT